MFNENQHIPLEHGELIYYPAFLSPPDADRLFDVLRRKVAWQQDRIWMAGREVLIPRLNAWYGDDGANYRYSGLQLTLNPWFEELSELRTALYKQLSTSFNSALLNLYRDGSDSVSWHSDDEPELGVNPLIASVSLGVTRRFQMRPKRGGDKRDLSLVHGSLLVMRGALQHHWQHQVPKQKGLNGSRINLTFRQVMVN